MLNYIITRLKEPSTWRGLILCCTSLGYVISPEQQEAIIFIGLFLAGMLGVTTPDSTTTKEVK